MKKSVTSFLLLILALSAYTQSSPETVAPVSQDFWGHHFALATNVKYGDSDEQRMDIYNQGQWIGEPQYWKSSTELHPTLVYIHGGGWLGGSKEQIVPFIIPYLERGWNVVTVEYRKGEASAPQAVDDVMQALLWVADHSAEYNIDNQRIVISGESAGGHLALISGMLNCIPGSSPFYSGNKLKIKAIVNWFGITDIAGVDTYYRDKGEAANYAALWVGAPERMATISDTYSPMKRITAGIPPIITIHGTDDSVVPYTQAIEMHMTLNDFKIRNELVRIDGGKHLGFTETDFQQIYTRIFSFLNKL